MLRIPDPVRLRAMSEGPAGEAWLAGLPADAADLAAEWELRLGPALPGGTEAYVAAAVAPDGRRAVLKIAPPWRDPAARELDLLLLARGRGYADVYRHDRLRRAMLLERLGPRLADLGWPPDAQAGAICETLKQAWLSPVGGLGFMTGAEKAASLGCFIEETWLALGRPCPARTVEAALRCAEDRGRAFDSCSAALAHGDCHPWNTLRLPGHGLGRFKLIDPDGFHVERAYDLGILMREWTSELLAGDPVALGERRCRLLSELTGVEPGPIWRWGMIERVSTGLLCLKIGLGGADDMLAVAGAWADAPLCGASLAPLPRPKRDGRRHLLDRGDASHPPRGDPMMAAMPTLHPDAARLIAVIRAAGRPAFQDLSPPDARAAYSAARSAMQLPPEDVAEARDLVMPGPGGPLRLRLYRGVGTGAGDALPGVLYLHGGGWMLGGLDSHDGVCRALANAGPCCVVTVDYRLAPEHPFPAAVDDSAAALAWVSAGAAALGIDPARIAVAGDSAGATLAAVLALMGRDGTVPAPCFQALIYPATDLAAEAPSYAHVPEGAPLTAATMRYFIERYVPDPAARLDWRASPLRAASLAGTAPALVLTVANDPLCDEGRAYALRLEQEGVRVAALHLSDQLHGLVTASAVNNMSVPSLDFVAAALRDAWRHTLPLPRPG